MHCGFQLKPTGEGAIAPENHMQCSKKQQLPVCFDSWNCKGFHGWQQCLCLIV